MKSLMQPNRHILRKLDVLLVFLYFWLRFVTYLSYSSKQPRKASLSRNLIALLNFGGVPESFFVDIVRNALEDAQGVFSNKRIALKGSFLISNATGSLQ